MPTINLPSMQRVLKETRESMGKETMPFHYSNEARLVAYALHGSFKAELNIKSMTRVQQRILRRVIYANIRMLRAHVAYAERKQTCRQLVFDLRAKTPT